MKREREERETLPFLYDLRRSGDRRSMGQGLKSEFEDYAWILETPSFAKVSRGRFVKSKASGSGSVRGTSSSHCSRFKR